jgi:hypothetical protein
MWVYQGRNVMPTNLPKYLSFRGAGQVSPSTMASATRIAAFPEAHVSFCGVGSREAMKPDVVGGE